MGGKRGAAPSPPSPVCCMCGDRGLSHELFRCKVCLIRSQHKYCSELYLKVENYRACNWCLREEGGKPKNTEANGHKIPTSCSSHDTTNYNRSSSDGCGDSGGVKLHRGDLPQHLDKPIKKKRLPQRLSSLDSINRNRSEEIPSNPGRGKQVSKCKVRRYKLLEEVSS